MTPWPLMPINMALTSDGKVQSFGSVGGWGTDTTPYDWTRQQLDHPGRPDGDRRLGPGRRADPREPASGLLPNTTYTDLFCSMQVQNPHTRATMTVGGDDGLGGNAPNDAAIGVTSYTTNNGLQNEAPMNFPRWYPTGTTMPDGYIVVQGGSLRGGPGGPGVLTPEIYTPDEGSGWKTARRRHQRRWRTATAATATGPTRTAGGTRAPSWRRAAATSSTSPAPRCSSSTPTATAATAQVTLRGTLPAGVANQGGLGNPVGATSTAAMYRPGKILQVGGGWWANGGGPAGARAGFTVDITGGTADPGRHGDRSR